MPIEFRCLGCGRLLRTPDDTAGKQAKCPNCGQILAIPAGTTSESSPTEKDPLRTASHAMERSPGVAPSDPNPYASRPAVKPDGGVIELVPTKISIDEVFQNAWYVFSSQIGPCVLFALLLVGVGIASYVLVFITALVAFVAGEATGSDEAGIVVGLVTAVIIAFPLAILLSWIIAGSQIFMVRLARGDHSTLRDVFSGWPCVWRTLGLGLVVVLLNLVILGVVTVPAAIVDNQVLSKVGQLIANIVAFVINLYLFLSIYLIVDRGLPVFESIRESVRFMQGNKLITFLIQLVVGACGVPMMLCTCFIGVLFFVPFVMLLQATIYLCATGQINASRRGVEA